MIVEPPGEPSARNGLPSRMHDRRRHRRPGPLAALQPVRVVGLPGRLKSVSSLLSRNPRSGTSSPEPPVASIVSVYSTTLPHRSATVRFVVSRPSVSRALAGSPRAGSHTPSADPTSPARTGFVVASAGSISQARSAANVWSSSRRMGPGCTPGRRGSSRGRRRPAHSPRGSRAAARRATAAGVELLQDVERLADGRAAGRRRRHRRARRSRGSRPRRRRTIVPVLREVARSHEPLGHRAGRCPGPSAATARPR